LGGEIFCSFLFPWTWCFCTYTVFRAAIICLYIYIIIRYTQIHIIWHTSYIIDISMMLCINWTADVAPPHTWSQVHCRSGGVGHFSGGQAHRVQCGKESEGVGVGTQTAEESADTNRSTIRRVHTV
jgi:hypothetical protein